MVSIALKEDFFKKKKGRKTLFQYFRKHVNNRSTAEGVNETSLLNLQY